MAFSFIRKLAAQLVSRKFQQVSLFLSKKQIIYESQVPLLSAPCAIHSRVDK